MLLWPYMLRWVKEFLFSSIAVQFPCSCALVEALKRLNAGTTKWYTPVFLTEAMVGTVAANRVWLRRFQPYYQNSFQPYFDGHFVDAAGKVSLVGRIGLRGWTKGFMCAWLSFSLLWAFGAIVHLGYNSHESVVPLLAGLGMFGAGIGFIALGRALLQDDVSWLSANIRKGLDTETRQRIERSDRSR